MKLHRCGIATHHSADSAYVHGYVNKALSNARLAHQPLGISLYRVPSSLAVIRAHFSQVGDEVALLPEANDQFYELLDKISRQRPIEIFLVAKANWYKPHQVRIKPRGTS
ncbi:hypothetical protein XU18_2243 [Perkinsela sp. CCAP 1560/4]|nr:hypothetical protein XU18_2243 [Perkinsela sp. CCAP 1560/4]|eukprot:KNH06972.1 hypothetical protein XU18_2243 [Perkinsela sp. CCAP 1560/4]